MDIKLEDRVEVRVFQELPNEFKAVDRFEFYLQSVVRDAPGVDASDSSLIEALHQSIFLINLNLVYNTFHLQNALARSFYFQQSNQMKTKTFDNEVCYQLSLTTKINESVKQFSVTYDSPSHNIAVIRVMHQDNEILSRNPGINTLSENILRLLTAEISAHELPFNELENILLTPTKKETILKYFKFSPEEKRDPKPIEVIITKIAIKDNL